MNVSRRVRLLKGIQTRREAKEYEMSDALVQLRNAIIDGRVKEVEGLTSAALSAGLTAQDILNQGLTQGMQVVGSEFKEGKKFIPEVLFSARAMQTSLNILKPLLAQAGTKMVGKVVIGTVKGDLHDIGKNLVGMLMEGAGFELVDLGRDVSPEKFLEVVRREKPDILALSALLTTTMRAMRQTITVLKEAGLRDTVKVLVGGAPVTADFAQEIGADSYGATAADAAEIAKKLVHAA
jgi:5-methyltetrahydrofolate--homocysteine methyltransferase